MGSSPDASGSVVRPVPGGVVLTVKVVPRSSVAGLAGVKDGLLRVRLTSPPVEGAANDELVRLIAKAFAVARSAVRIEGGQRSRVKRVRVSGVDAASAAAVVAGSV